uniref:THAP-type domain-containing protein n=1 Tax=Eptatretus burgeri TaxID=7764 RepID=A0A8C4R6Q7_EPTBU
MPRSCSSFDCRMRQSDEIVKSGVTFHRFPKEPVIRQRWVCAMRRVDRGADQQWVPGPGACLCSRHFHEQDFFPYGERQRLKPDAVPSFFSFKVPLDPKESACQRCKFTTKNLLRFDRHVRAFHWSHIPECILFPCLHCRFRAPRIEMEKHVLTAHRPIFLQLGKNTEQGCSQFEPMDDQSTYQGLPREVFNEMMLTLRQVAYSCRLCKCLSTVYNKIWCHVPRAHRGAYSVDSIAMVAVVSDKDLLAAVSSRAASQAAAHATNMKRILLAPKTTGPPAILVRLGEEFCCLLCGKRGFNQELAQQHLLMEHRLMMHTTVLRGIQGLPPPPPLRMAPPHFLPPGFVVATNQSTRPSSPLQPPPLLSNPESTIATRPIFSTSEVTCVPSDQTSVISGPASCVVLQPNVGFCVCCQTFIQKADIPRHRISCPKKPINTKVVSRPSPLPSLASPQLISSPALPQGLISNAGAFSTTTFPSCFPSNLSSSTSVPKTSGPHIMERIPDVSSKTISSATTSPIPTWPVSAVTSSVSLQGTTSCMPIPPLSTTTPLSTLQSQPGTVPLSNLISSLLCCHVCRLNFSTHAALTEHLINSPSCFSYYTDLPSAPVNSSNTSKPTMPLLTLMVGKDGSSNMQPAQLLPQQLQHAQQPFLRLLQSSHPLQRQSHPSAPFATIGLNLSHQPTTPTVSHGASMKVKPRNGPRVQVKENPQSTSPFPLPRNVYPYSIPMHQTVPVLAQNSVPGHMSFGSNQPRSPLLLPSNHQMFSLPRQEGSTFCYPSQFMMTPVSTATSKTTTQPNSVMYNITRVGNALNPLYRTNFPTPTAAQQIPQQSRGLERSHALSVSDQNSQKGSPLWKDKVNKWTTNEYFKYKRTVAEMLHQKKRKQLGNDKSGFFPVVMIKRLKLKSTEGGLTVTEQEIEKILKADKYLRQPFRSKTLEPNVLFKDREDLSAENEVYVDAVQRGTKVAESMAQRLARANCFFCPKIVSGPRQDIREQLAKHLAFSHGVVQNYDDVHKQVRYSCIRCKNLLGYPLNQFSLDWHHERCKSILIKQLPIASMSPAGSSSMVTVSTEMKNTSEKPTVVQGDVVSRPVKSEKMSKLEMKRLLLKNSRCIRNKLYLEKYMNQQPYPSKKELVKIANHLDLKVNDVARKFAFNRYACQKAMKKLQSKVLLGFDEHALSVVKHCLVFKNEPSSSVHQVIIDASDGDMKF